MELSRATQMTPVESFFPLFALHGQSELINYFGRLISCMNAKRQIDFGARDLNR
jgi:hypothetical protein